jgi:NAD(P)H-hydrate epimerase
MQILTSAEIRAWDEFTMANEPIPSIELMERAARACFEWILQNGFSGKNFFVYCGKGNNGGDGLAIARLLFNTGNQVQVYIPDSVSPGTIDFQANLQKLRELQVPLQFITSSIPTLPSGAIIIDALLGTGLNRPVEGWMTEVVQSINRSGNTIIAIDIPSGLSADKSSTGHPVVCATHTLSFQNLKPAFIVAENERFIGMLHLLHIGLHPDFLKSIRPSFTWITAALAKEYFRPRSRFSHKGTFGHALLISGQYGSMGAAVLAAKGALSSGTGLLTVQVPRMGNIILQTAVPEAMSISDEEEKFITCIPENIDRFQAIGIGPGLGTHKRTGNLLHQLFKNYRKPVVLDADALNLIAQDPQLLDSIPARSVLTPHPKEFERLFGKCENDFLRIDKAKAMAIQHNVVIVLKGHYTCIFYGNECYVNSTGNAGMAKGGSGDVLTGMLTGLLAQGYDSKIAAILGVYIHGKAGDLALTTSSYESMLPSDLVNHTGSAFRSIYP